MSFDIEKIKVQVQNVLEYSQNLGFVPKVDGLLNKWLAAKAGFIEKFGNKLIYEVEEPITFNLSEKDKKEKLNDFLNRVACCFDNCPLADFIESNGIDNFYNNIVKAPYTLDTGEKIPAGMKLLKTFKFFEDNEETIKKLQSEASMIIQENKIEGILCFSVHPLDFLSISETTYNWRSCHALDGEYRSGNLSYMVDSSTFVCYLKGRRADGPLPRFPDSVPWNSKKWRVLLYMSEQGNAMFAGRQYPFMSDGGLEIITPYLRQALRQEGVSTWSGWHDDVLTGYSYKNGKDSQLVPDYDWTKTVVLGGRYYNLYDLVKDGEGSRHFNDLLRSNYYTPFYCWNRRAACDASSRYSSGRGTSFTIGASAPCICCGEENVALTDVMMCEPCAFDSASYDNDDLGTCDCCGNRCWWDDLWETNTNEYVCPHCRETECVKCAECECLTFKDFALWDRGTENYYCRDCWSGRTNFIKGVSV